MAELLEVRCANEFIEIKAGSNLPVNLFTKHDSVDIKQAIMNLEDVIEKLESYIDHSKEQDGT
jgi:hypothetical protein